MRPSDLRKAFCVRRVQPECKARYPAPVSAVRRAQTVLGIFDSRAVAEQAVQGLLATPIAPRFILFLSSEAGKAQVENLTTTDTERDGMGEVVGGVVGCVKKTRKRHAVRKMKVGPSEPPCRGRLQTAVSCFSQKLRW